MEAQEVWPGIEMVPLGDERFPDGGFVLQHHAVGGAQLNCHNVPVLLNTDFLVLVNVWVRNVVSKNERYIYSKILLYAPGGKGLSAVGLNI